MWHSVAARSLRSYLRWRTKFGPNMLKRWGDIALCPIWHALCWIRSLIIWITPWLMWTVLLFVCVSWIHYTKVICFSWKQKHYQPNKNTYFHAVASQSLTDIPDDLAVNFLKMQFISVKKEEGKYKLLSGCYVVMLNIMVKLCVLWPAGIWCEIHESERFLNISWLFD